MRIAKIALNKFLKSFAERVVFFFGLGYNIFATQINILQKSGCFLF